MPVVPGRKTEREKFAGAVRSYTIEALMGDGKALQSATSHNLGQNFAKAFEIQFLDANNELEHAWQTSWGLSTRIVGAIIMVHGDDHGLRLPPRLAPIQLVIVPIWKNEGERSTVMSAVQDILELLGHHVRVQVDERDERPGWKFNEWELRGVPLRLEIGPRDVADNTVVLARRDTGEKVKVRRPDLVDAVPGLLAEIQQGLLEQAVAFRDAHTYPVSTWEDFLRVVEAGGFITAYWAGSAEDEDRIQDQTGATIRCLPLEQPREPGVCFYTGQPADTVALFARAY